MITVIDPPAARQALAAGDLGCPQPGCDGRLRPWSRASERRVRGLDGTVDVVRPDRGRCRVCGVTHVLLPAALLPRRGYRVEVIGAALQAAANGAGYARAATACQAPISTVRDWIRAARRGATGLIARAVQTLATVSDSARAWPCPEPSRPALTAAMHALAAAAEDLPRILDQPRNHRAQAGTGGGTGIDYLALITTGHRDHVLRFDLRLADPAALPAATPWQRVAIVTAGHLLTT